MNPCPCGFLGDSDKRCTCRESDRTRYMSRLGGPLLDRIDVCLRVDRVDPEVILSCPAAETTEQVADRAANCLLYTSPSPRD